MSQFTQRLGRTGTLCRPAKSNNSRGFWGLAIPIRSLLAAAVFLTMCDQAAAEDVDLSGIVRVEEDWQIEMGTPDPEGDAPQIIFAVSPYSTLGSTHAVFELNHRTLPSYVAGGMQLQTWINDMPYTYNNFPNATICATDNELIKFTMAMNVSGSTLTFEILNGSSTTWGAFGPQGYLKSTVAYPYSSLWGYSPTASVNNARIGYASFRVRKLVLKEVRYYRSTGLVYTDTTPRVAHEHNPDL